MNKNTATVLTKIQKVRSKRLQEVYNKRKGLMWNTQAEFAAKLKIGASAVSQYFSNAKAIKSDKARLFEGALKLKEEYLDKATVLLYLLSDIGDIKNTESLEIKVNGINKAWNAKHNVIPILRADFILGNSDVHLTVELHDVDEIPLLIAEIYGKGLTNTKTMLVIKEPIIFDDVK
jgi:transcriptional regulator with XRE-family HTH domain